MAINKKPTYAEAIGELEEIVRSIESDSVDVDQLTRQVARAKFLITFCKSRLRQTEDEVNKVLAEIDTQGAEDTPLAQAAADDEGGLF